MPCAVPKQTGTMDTVPMKRKPGSNGFELCSALLETTERNDWVGLKQRACNHCLRPLYTMMKHLPQQTHPTTPKDVGGMLCFKGRPATTRVPCCTLAAARGG